MGAQSVWFSQLLAITVPPYRLVLIPAIIVVHLHGVQGCVTLGHLEFFLPSTMERRLLIHVFGRAKLPVILLLGCPFLVARSNRPPQRVQLHHAQLLGRLAPQKASVLLASARIAKKA